MAAVALESALVCGLVCAQSTSTSPSPAPGPARLPVAARTNALSTHVPALNFDFDSVSGLDLSPFKVQGSPVVVQFSPNGSVRGRFKDQQPFFSLMLPSPSSKPAPARPEPGVYETAPFTGIVVVPGPHPDDRMVVRLGAFQPSMPNVQPELRFIPRGSGKK
jgi:hypothetical protein